MWHKLRSKHEATTTSREGPLSLHVDRILLEAERLCKTRHSLSTWTYFPRFQAYFFSQKGSRVPIRGYFFIAL